MYTADRSTGGIDQQLYTLSMCICHSATILSETSVMLSSNVWPRLKANEKGQVAITLCPQRTTSVPMPPELSKLDALSSQLIQHARCHQTWYILCESSHLQFSLHSTKFSKLHLLSAIHCTVVHEPSQARSTAANTLRLLSLKEACRHAS